MTERFFVSDTIEADLHPVDEDGGVDEDVTLDGFDWSEQHVVVIDNPPWEHAFETDEYFRFESTVARPIPQEYHLPADRVPDDLVADGHGGRVSVTLKKPAEELEQSQWRLDNAPYTLGHPRKGIVTDGDEVHGFWRYPDYVHNDSEPDEQRLRLYVPTNDERAKRFLDDHQSVSVGFHADFEFTVDDDDPHADVLDGYQRNLHYDHVAGVTQGRCSEEDGCKVSIGDSVQADTTAAESDTVAVHGGCTPDDCSCGLHESHDGEDESETDADTPDDSTDTMTDDPDNDNDDSTPTIDVGSLSVDAVRDRHDAVDEALTEKDDRIDELEEQLEAVKDNHEDLKQVVDEFERGERTPKAALVDDITDLTDHWDEEELLDTDSEVLRDRLEALEDTASTPTTIDDPEDTEPETTTDSQPEDVGKELTTGVVDLSETA